MLCKQQAGSSRQQQRKDQDQNSGPILLIMYEWRYGAKFWFVIYSQSYSSSTPTFAPFAPFVIANTIVPCLFLIYCLARINLPSLVCQKDGPGSYVVCLHWHCHSHTLLLLSVMARRRVSSRGHQRPYLMCVVPLAIQSSNCCDYSFIMAEQSRKCGQRRTEPKEERRSGLAVLWVSRR